MLLVAVLQYTTKRLSSRRLRNLGISVVFMLRICYNDSRVRSRLTESTTSMPPLSHLYLLRFSWCHFSSSPITFALPHSLLAPRSLSTIQARGTFSSSVRPPETPATVASVIRCKGWARRQSSISTGETWAPETLRVS